ncbi:MAG: DUF2505 family protein [Deltaproteobacteria bacterium]|nr:DUF2505 family protein [Deltaproteobacteria bacterium]
MKTLEKKRSLKIDRTALIDILTNPEFEVERETSANGSVKAVVNETRRTDSELEYEIITTEYVKGVTGIDKSKTEDNRYVYTWNLKNFSCDWVYTMKSQGSRVKVFGSISLHDNNGTDIKNIINVEIKIPLVGGKIEKMVMSEIEKGWGKYDEILDRWIAEKSA